MGAIKQLIIEEQDRELNEIGSRRAARVPAGGGDGMADKPTAAEMAQYKATGRKLKEYIREFLLDSMCRPKITAKVPTGFGGRVPFVELEFKTPPGMKPIKCGAKASLILEVGALKALDGALIKAFGAYGLCRVPSHDVCSQVERCALEGLYWVPSHDVCSQVERCALEAILKDVVLRAAKYPEVLDQAYNQLGALMVRKVQDA